MAALFAHTLTLADGISIKFGSFSWTFGTNFLIYLLIAAIIGIIAEAIAGWRLPFGIVGAIIAGVVGIWLLTQVIQLTGFGDIYIDGVPLIRALIGAIILIAIWHLVTYRAWSRPRRRSFYRS